jgi:putative membrane-bound dehydrogenase-like protein
MEFDDRGRIWVVQYLQYPNPAGLKRTTVDRFSRTVYDRVPEPPPFGPRGADRITILSDLDSTGRARSSKDFIAGLNLASGIAFGHGGVFVIQVPYLLFYPDRDRDDRPDSNPEVLLSGFGMEDAHSVANSLTWGPDGWLYGCQGSTVTARIRGIEFQQGVWRYHPITRAFELFCEGGGNSWGLDFDRRGNLVYSTNVGGYIGLHAEQGAYYWKAFGKHGALHNPHAYGYFEHMAHRGFRGGHVTVGGVFYRGDAFPAGFRDKYIGADLLGHNVYWHELHPLGSTFQSRFGGELLLSRDSWFAPSDVTVGPDGAVYVADWHDSRTAHPDPDAEWDRGNGRIYRVSHGDGRPRTIPDFRALPSRELVAMLGHRNDWFSKQALRALAERRDPEVILPLRRLVFEGSNDDLTLQSLWALYVSGGFSDAFAVEALKHPNADVRRWAVRLLGDECQVRRSLSDELAHVAGLEQSMPMRMQLAATAKRLPAADALPIVRQLIKSSDSRDDDRIGLMLWWAIESHAISARNEVLAMLTDDQMLEKPMAFRELFPRLIRRYAAENSEAGFASCLRLLRSASGARLEVALTALDQGLPLRATLPGEFARALADHCDKETADLVRIRLLLRANHGGAIRRALALCNDRGIATPQRNGIIAALGDFPRGEFVGVLLKLADDSHSESTRLAALDALRNYDRPEIAATVIRLCRNSSGAIRTRMVDLLVGRTPWANALLNEVDAKRLPADAITVEQLRRLPIERDERRQSLIRKHWGNIQQATPEEKLAEVRRLNNDLRAASGDKARGRTLFAKHCGACHKLFGEGGMIGPDLTHANRKDRDYLLISIVDPSAIVRPEFMSHLVRLADGRQVAGLIVDQSGDRLTIVQANQERITVHRDRIEELSPSITSLMPENIVKDLKPQELRDLFAYLQSDPSP